MPYWASSCSSRWLKASHGQMTVMSVEKGPAVPSGPCCPHLKWGRPSSQDTPALGVLSGHPAQEDGCSRPQGGSKGGSSFPSPSNHPVKPLGTTPLQGDLTSDVGEKIKDRLGASLSEPWLGGARGRWDR